MLFLCQSFERSRTFGSEFNDNASKGPTVLRRRVLTELRMKRILIIITFLFYHQVGSFKSLYLVTIKSRRKYDE